MRWCGEAAHHPQVLVGVDFAQMNSNGGKEKFMDHRNSVAPDHRDSHPGTEAPKRIQLSREKGWRLPDNAVKVDRSTQWGNPYRIGERMSMPMARHWGWDISPKGQKIVCEDASEAVKRFAHCLQWDEAIHSDLLKGRPFRSRSPEPRSRS
jgi:hypothetical protein